MYSCMGGVSEYAWTTKTLETLVEGNGKQAGLLCRGYFLALRLMGDR